MSELWGGVEEIIYNHSDLPMPTADVVVLSRGVGFEMFLENIHDGLGFISGSEDCPLVGDDHRSLRLVCRFESSGDIPYLVVFYGFLHVVVELLDSMVLD